MADALLCHHAGLASEWCQRDIDCSARGVIHIEKDNVMRGGTGREGPRRAYRIASASSVYGWSNVQRKAAAAFRPGMRSALYPAPVHLET